jgi:N-acetylmuramoyl-L-alanine amidase
VRRATAITITILLLAPVLLVRAQGTPPPSALTLIAREGRRAVPTIMQSGQELIGLDDVVALFQVTVAEDAPTGGVTVSYRGRTIVLSAEQSIASVNGRVVTLPAPVTRSGRRLMVPVEFLSRALGPIYDRRIDLRRASRLLIVGDLTVPRVVARIDAVGPPTRATIDVTPAAPVAVSSDVGRLIVRIEADALDLTLPAGGGLIEQIRAGDQPNTVALILGGAAGTPRTTSTTSDGAARLMIEVPAAAAPGGDTTAAPPPAPAPPTDTLAVGVRPRFSLVAIDPGHGGDDPGVKAGEGLEEKELTLDVARRLRQRLETRLGVRAVLTRDEDRSLTPDERAAVANNSKADLFLSLHANGALGPGVSGAEVYFLSLDDEGETVRRTATAGAVSLPVLGGGRRVVEVVPWNLAQAAHIDQSAKLAGTIEEELRKRVPMSPRAVQRAGMRVLTGANMPAALVEMAYLTNRDQAVGARTDDFRNAVADALFEAVSRFRAAALEPPAPTPTTTSKPASSKPTPSKPTPSRPTERKPTP